ncbi:lasso peptide biosynthesis B2 protein [Bacillus sp. ISL-35]|uniref:lasso peptide biosynthesis B2 protein n=1 Tax=Bacillus sp. ISL-35 TaxID=2819122 RepID=UPI001BE5A8F2|nr:lasso peptide biosynthesis B2 protein [Bacillus sp. ISL-35]MBT2679840.1 lasso peptide biosynthesis B2 protein [Bacillus sp. ISL-35]MBT2704875.1 lasso peptide biosynthesis B2 protein [Chryseobacterium sp. ISL-80]
MRFLTMLNTFVYLSTKKKLLFIEAFLFLGWARILKMLPFSKVAPSLGDKMNETPYNSIDSHSIEIKNVSYAIHIMSKYTFWESECLVKAVAGMKMLKRRNIDSTLYLGIAKDAAGKMIAHAWLRSGSFYISGSEGMEKFTIVGVFAKRIKSN